MGVSALAATLLTSAPLSTDAAAKNSEVIDLKKLGYWIDNVDGIDNDGIGFFYYEDQNRLLMDVNLAGGDLAEELNKVIDNRNNPENAPYGFSETVTVSGTSGSGSLHYLPNEWYGTDTYQLEIDYNGKTYTMPFRIKTGGKDIESGATYTIMSKSSALFLEPMTEFPQARILQQLSNNEKDQKWIIRETSKDSNVYTIQNAKTEMYLDVPGSSKSDKTQIIQYENNGEHENQLWRLIDAGNGYYYIRNVNSGLNLDVPGSSIAHNEAMIQFKPLNGANQQFKLIKQQ